MSPTFCSLFHATPASRTIRRTGDSNHDRNHATHDSIYESEPSRDNEVITVGACFNISEAVSVAVSVARRERSRESALYCAARSKPASNISPSRTVFGVCIVKVCPWDAHSGLHMNPQQNPGHQLVGDVSNNLHRKQFVLVTRSINMK